MEKRKGFINRKYKGHVFAGLAAIVIATTGFTLSSCTTETKIEPPVIEKQEEVDDLELIIDEVNDFAAIEERLIHFVENAGLHGLGELNVEDVLALYILLNIEDISPSQAAHLYDDRFNAEILMDKATQMINTVASDALYSKPGHMIDVASLIVNPNSQVELIKIQELIARYNVASEAEKLDVVGILVKEIEDLYASDQWKKLPDGVSMLIQSKIWFVYHNLLNDKAVFNRYGNKLEALELIMFANQTNCIENKEARYNPNIASRYSDNSIEARKNLEYKYDEQMKEYAEKNKVASKFKLLVANVIEKAKIVFVARESIEENQMAKKEHLMQETVTTTQKPVSPTNQTPITKEKIDQTNQDAELRAKGMKDGFEAGNRDAIFDTTNSSSLGRPEPFPRKFPTGYDAKYANQSAYTQVYIEEYNKEYRNTIIEQAAVLGKYQGMNYGARLVEQGLTYTRVDSIVESKYRKFNGTEFASPYLSAFNQAARVSYDEFKKLMDDAKKEHGDDVQGPTIIEKGPNETVVIVPGITVDANGYLWDSSGNPIYDENGNHMRQVGQQQSYQPADTQQNTSPQPEQSQPREDIYNSVEDTTIIGPDHGGTLYDEQGNVIQWQSLKIR